MFGKRACCTCLYLLVVRPSSPRLTWLGFRYVEECIHYAVRGSGAIREVQLIVVEAAVYEALALVHLQSGTMLSNALQAAAAAEASQAWVPQ